MEGQMDTVAGIRQEPTPIGAGRKGRKSEFETLKEALDKVDLAVSELDLAVGVALGTKVPGVDVGANLAAKLVPVLARIGHDIKPAKKARAPKA